ncbi:MAG: DNA-protecting protein DprA [Clostridia bacterium]|jgi:DNA processing protein|nr:DNA-protecting protein DprA [Clostridia bacterium]
MEEKIYWIWLSRINGLGATKKNKLLDIYKSPKEIWNLEIEELTKIEGIGEKTAQNILDYKYKKDLEKYIDYMKKYKIDVITIQDKEYPKKLKNIYSAPILLYTKGNKNILNESSISVIGCRQCSKYGEKIAKKISYELAKNKINIVSGLARGIDSFAHIGSLEAKGKTIAILGSGLDRIYPKENIYLYDSIINSEGLILSEYIIGTPPNRLNFPERNRIVSGISNGTVVIEAKEKSGTLITVDFALEQGKEVFVVPGNITSETSKGTNNLIKQGAKLVTCVEDILEEYKF